MALQSNLMTTHEQTQEDWLVWTSCRLCQHWSWAAAWLWECVSVIRSCEDPAACLNQGLLLPWHLGRLPKGGLILHPTRVVELVRFVSVGCSCFGERWPCRTWDACKQAEMQRWGLPGLCCSPVLPLWLGAGQPHSAHTWGPGNTGERSLVGSSSQ